ncbi:MAG TPA: hypothetical protein VM510_03240 [Caulifigura sp.]|nr:hypothetical protein [Caulifigura sp.]
MTSHNRSKADQIAQLLARGATAASVASLLFASSCASTPLLMSRKARKEAAIAKKNPNAIPLTDASTGKPSPSYADRLEAAKQAQKSIPKPGEPGVQQAVVGEQHLAAARIEQMSHEEPAKEGSAQFAATTDRPWAPDLNGQPTVAPLNDALVVAQMFPPQSALCRDCPPAQPVAAAAACGNPRPFPTENGRDEYVCDGGDKGRPVHYEDGLIAGLEAEDTVAEFSDGTGQQRVVKSNEVCVYAPRFGVARAVSEAVEKFTVNTASGTHDGVVVAGYVHRAAIDEKKDTESLAGIKTDDRLSLVRNRQADGEVENDMAVASHVKLVNPFEDYGFVQDGVFRRAEKSVLYQGMRSAGEWTIDRGTVAVAKDEAGLEVIATFDVEELIGVTDMRTPGDLRIVKLADKKTAKLGEIVTFTIRFDNLGGKDLYKIRILDNLSPRLELIDSSVTCDVAGELEISESAQGGEVLTFRVNDSLAGHSGGSLTFQCKIR